MKADGGVDGGKEGVVIDNSFGLVVYRSAGSNIVHVSM